VIDDHQTFGPFRVEQDETVPPGTLGFRSPRHTAQRRLVVDADDRPNGVRLVLLHHRPGEAPPVIIAESWGVNPALPPTTVCSECGALVSATGVQLTAAVNPDAGRARVGVDPAGLDAGLVFLDDDGAARMLRPFDPAVGVRWAELARAMARCWSPPLPPVRETLAETLGKLRAATAAAREAERIEALGPPNTMGATAGQVAVGAGIYVTPVGHDSTPGQEPGEGGDQA
jgi:hypothetical protein